MKDKEFIRLLQDGIEPVLSDNFNEKILKRIPVKKKDNKRFSFPDEPLLIVLYLINFVLFIAYLFSPLAGKNILIPVFMTFMLIPIFIILMNGITRKFSNSIIA